MALLYPIAVVLVISATIVRSQANTGNSSTPIIHPILDLKRRNHLVDEAFLEQKDILLDMLETKLKEVHDKRKKKIDPDQNINEPLKCETMPRNVDVILKAHGISAIGETDVQLKYGEDGNGTLSLDAIGISNVGKAHVELGVGEGSIHAPGIRSIFTGEIFSKKDCRQESDLSTRNSKMHPQSYRADNNPTRRVEQREETFDVMAEINGTSNYGGKIENETVNENTAMKYIDEGTSSVLSDITTIIPEQNGNATENGTDI